MGADAAPADAPRFSTDGTEYCAVLSLGGVVCWATASLASSANGQGSRHVGDPERSAVPVQVEGAASAAARSPCHQSGAKWWRRRSRRSKRQLLRALLNTGGVDCWGDGGYGEARETGMSIRSSPDQLASPVQVDGFGGLAFSRV